MVDYTTSRFWLEPLKLLELEKILVKIRKIDQVQKLFETKYCYTLEKDISSFNKQLFDIDQYNLCNGWITYQFCFVIIDILFFFFCFQFYF